MEECFMKFNTVVVLVIVLLVSMIGVSKAQFELKPAIGINLTDFSKDPQTGETSGRVAWQIGATISTGDKFYGEAGAFWDNKSNEIKEDVTNTTIETDLSGVRIPVMVGYHFLGKETGTVGLRGFGGGSVFILTSVSDDLNKDDFTSPTYGVFLGFGLDVAMFFVDWKYEWSLSDVVSANDFDLGKTRSVYLNAGMRFSL
jgi:hypothetical protein